MKRLFLVFSILLANLAAFAGPIDDNCSTIYDSIIAGDISKAEDAASKVYAQKSACSATNLADLAIIHQLVDKSSDAVTRYDYVLKTIDCYNSAVGKDSNAARARFTEKRVDMDAVANNYNANLSKFQQAVSDSMNF